MLRSRISCTFATRRWMSYFSTEFNALANEGPAKFPHLLPQGSQHAVAATNIDLDLFVNADNRQLDLVDRLLKLRKQKECSFVPLLPGLLVKQLLDSTNPQEAITVLRSPSQYGLFIDQFSGCFLMDVLLHSGNTLEAAQIAALLVDRGLCNNELVEALALQSFFKFVKDFKPVESSDSKPAASPAPEVEKVRVKFVRNVVEETSKETEEAALGRAMIEMGSGEGTLKELKQNIALIGFVLSGRLPEAVSLLAQNREAYHKETLTACQSLADSLKLEVSDEFTQSLQQTLDKCTQNSAIHDKLESSVRSSAQKFEPKLLAEYGQSYQAWTKQFENAVKQFIDEQSLVERKQSIEKTLRELEAKRQNLWFFENKDDIDIQIYKKKVKYPQRWFGKKKTPKAADTFYVPPSVTRSAN
ncbi:uncharacterized protein LOC117578420 [Drosophila guanche]|uniref:Blast:Paired mesoderm homeobox protein 2B n=1 Tax=Drosophila guanche TaxID=7266 RepID=A0A3B0J2E0_DROGU|nr:uncharacterized protein LOC117578420 [Drosophila guanche]SPP73163.1 blast:Paired mesoderm homeobox protein 2B [Drosophila guanche]